MSRIQNPPSNRQIQLEKERIRVMAREMEECMSLTPGELRNRARTALAVLTSRHDMSSSVRTSDRYVMKLFRAADKIDQLVKSDPEEDILTAMQLDEWLSERSEVELAVLMKLALEYLAPDHGLL